MITVTPAATIALKDSGLSPNPNPVPFGGLAVNCPKGALVQDVVLVANSSDVTLTFPVGVTTAAVLAILAADVSDLVVTNDGVDLTVPLGQPLLLYSVAAADISVSSVKGGKVTYVVGG